MYGLFFHSLQRFLVNIWFVDTSYVLSSKPLSVCRMVWCICSEILQRCSTVHRDWWSLTICRTRDDKRFRQTGHSEIYNVLRELKHSVISTARNTKLKITSKQSELTLEMWNMNQPAFSPQKNLHLIPFLRCQFRLHLKSAHRWFFNTDNTKREPGSWVSD